MTDLEKMMLAKENLQEAKELRAAILRLHNNRDFKTVIEEGYLKDEAVRALGSSIDTNISDEARADALAMAQGCARLGAYLSTIMQITANADADLEEVDNYITELRAAGKEA